jgi:3-oxoacyl-[acyl-carrier-protein] synthase III
MKIKSRLESIGLYVPETVVTTVELMQRMVHNLPLRIDLEKITGVRTRRWRSENETSFTMAMNAAHECLNNSRYRPEDLDIIISTSITRSLQPNHYFFDPAFSLFIKKELGANNARHFDISNACAGMITGAFLLDNMIRAGVVKNGMVVSGECITPIAETALNEISDFYSDQFASLTLGDAGSAIILDASGVENEGIDFIEFVTVAKHAHQCIGRPSDLSTGAAMFTKSKEMHEAGLFKRGAFFLDQVLQLYNDHLESYDYIIAHQVTEGAVKAYLKAVSDQLGVSHVPTLMSVQDYGNTASTTLFLVLYNGLKEKKLKQGSKIMFITLASGIGLGAMSITLGGLEV